MLTHPQHPEREIERHLRAILAAQKVEPYRGWNLTELNRAVDAARAFLGLPSVRELNPDIAAMQDRAKDLRDHLSQGSE